MSNLIKNFVFFANDNDDPNNMINVRTIIDPNNEPYFVARDIATALGYENTKKAVSDHCFNPISVADFVNTLQSQGARFVTPIEINNLQMQTKLIREPDVYALIFRSKLESAKRFQLWVFEEVLPSIRKTGKYSVNQNQNVFDESNPLYRLMDERFERLEKLLIPKAIVYDLIIKQDEEYSMEEAAKLLNQKLSLDGTRYKLSNHILLQFLRNRKYVSNRNIAYTKYIDLGYFVYKFSTRFNQNTGQVENVFSSTLFTTKGLDWIIGPLKTAGLLPVAFNPEYLHPVNMISYDGVEVIPVH